MLALLRKSGHEAARAIGAAFHYRANPLWAAQRYWSLYRDRRFSPDEIHFLRLLDPSISGPELATVVSKEELVSLQRQLNPPSLHSLTEDKLVFYGHCRKAGLPVPEILALYATNGDPPAQLRLLTNEGDVDSFLQQSRASALILKPVGGVHGDGVTRLTRGRAGWENHGTAVVSATDIVRLIETSIYRRWMFQENVRGHPELRAISDTDSLQTVRVVTAIDMDGTVEILAARLRLICGATAHDNFDYGRTGNLIAILDIGQGTIQSVIGGKGEPRAIYHVTRHPRTGRALHGFRVPDWEAVRKLVHDAARAFLPLRTIGWDVAITPAQPCLIEGNVTWDTLTGEPRMGDIYRHLQGLARDNSTSRD